MTKPIKSKEHQSFLQRYWRANIEEWRIALILHLALILGILELIHPEWFPLF